MSKVTSYSTLNLIGSLIPIGAFVVVGVLSYIAIINLLDDENWVTHTYTVIDKLDLLLTTMVDAEAGQRGYLITGNLDYLEPYNSAASSVNNQISELRQLTLDNPTQQSNIDKLVPLVKERMDQLANNVNLRKSNDVSDIIKNINGLDQGKITMDKIRVVVNDMKNEEEQLLVNRTATSQSVTQNTQIIIILGTIAAIIITAISTIIINKKLRDRQKLEKTNLELQIESAKLHEIDKTKGELFAMVSHELKTPLVTISGYAEMLKENGVLGTLNKDQTDAVDTINSQVLKLERLINDVLDAQKMDLKRMKFNKKEFEVDKFMDEQIHTHSKIMNDKKTQFINSTVEKIRFVSDPDRLGQVFANLIKNAVDFVPASDGLIEINAQSKNSHVVFYVKDNGSGIPKEKQENLFKKFYQIDASLKRSHGGTGLGLVICKGIVEALGGKIWVESEVGKGTTFWFSIPMNGISQVESDVYT
ncbi:MAG TPA: CHASE3 domain-containing protein [Candidatus Nitrosotalea sp.]|nr:CHASE3 domain-containing protein [Candidatus Nitrosotalea sp.]